MSTTLVVHYCSEYALGVKNFKKNDNSKIKASTWEQQYRIHIKYLFVLYSSTIILSHKREERDVDPSDLEWGS